MATLSCTVPVLSSLVSTRIVSSCAATLRARPEGKLHAGSTLPGRPAGEAAPGCRHDEGMSEPYNLFSGQSLERLTALSDGLFAVAMTLLVLDVRVPVSSAGAVYSERGLWEALLGLGPSFAAYLLSFTMQIGRAACRERV